MSMSGGVVQRGAGWSYVVRVTDPATGKRKPKWVSGFKTRDAAVAARQLAVNHPAAAVDYLSRPLPCCPPDSPTRCYFAERDGLIKVGRTTRDPRERARELGARLLADIPGSAALEAALHHRFGVYWSHGEWFYPGQALLAYIRGLV